jgi:hypothetical protein
MFKTLDEMIRFRRTRLEMGRQHLIRALSGIALSAAGFQAVYSLLYAIE